MFGKEHASALDKSWFYDYLSAVYARCNVRYADLINRAVQMLAPAAGSTVLEIGFGPGYALEALATLVGEEGTVCGIELSPKMLEIARQRLETSELSGRVLLASGDALQLPYRSGAFDSIFMSFTLCLFHQGDVPRLLAEIRRVLKPDGRLGILAMYDERGWRLMPLLYRVLYRLFPAMIEICGRPIDCIGDLKDNDWMILQRSEEVLWGIPIVTVVSNFGSLSRCAASRH